MRYVTDRLCLRSLTPGDEPGVLRLLSDIRVVRYTNLTLFTPEHAHAFVESACREAEEQPRHFLALALAQPDGAALIGLCGLVLHAHLEDGEAWYLLDPALGPGVDLRGGAGAPAGWFHRL